MDGVEAGWHPDPEGRHELRYWNGVDWSEHVSDGGVTAVDPLTPVVVTPVGLPPVPAAPSRSRKPWGLIVIGVIVAAAVAGGLIVFVGGDDGGGGNAFGTRQLAVDADNPLVAIRLDLDAGQAFRYRVVPGAGDVDLVAVIAGDNDTTLQTTELDLFTEATETVAADELSDFFTDSAATFSDSDGLDSLGFGDEEWWEFDRADFGLEGDGESGFFAAPVSGDYLLIVGTYDGENFSDFELTVEEYGERFDFEVEESDIEEQFSDASDFFADPDFFSDIDFSD